MSDLLHREVSSFRSPPTTIYLVCTMCKALSVPQFVMTVKKDSCQCKASMSVDEYINKQINGKENLGSGDFDCSLLCAGSQSPYFPLQPPGPSYSKNRAALRLICFPHWRERHALVSTDGKSPEIKGLGWSSGALQRSLPIFEVRIVCGCRGEGEGEGGRLLCISEQASGVL